MDQPLFGETRRRDKIANIGVAIATAIMIGITLLMAIISSVFFSGHEKCLRLYRKKEVYCVYAVDIIMCFVIMLLLVPQILVAYWYRRGELDPKFRTLIYYNAAVIVLLCVVSNLYFFQVGFQGHPSES